jgi:hypothetical protein
MRYWIQSFHYLDNSRLTPFSTLVHLFCYSCIWYTNGWTLLSLFSHSHSNLVSQSPIHSHTCSLGKRIRKQNRRTNALCTVQVTSNFHRYRSWGSIQKCAAWEKTHVELFATQNRFNNNTLETCLYILNALSGTENHQKGAPVFYDYVIALPNCQFTPYLHLRRQIWLAVWNMITSIDLMTLSSTESLRTRSSIDIEFFIEIYSFSRFRKIYISRNNWVFGLRPSSVF